MPTTMVPTLHFQFIMSKSVSIGVWTDTRNVVLSIGIFATTNAMRTTVEADSMFGRETSAAIAMKSYADRVCNQLFYAWHTSVVRNVCR